MLLRSTIDRLLPAGEEENRLSPEARNVFFAGPYFFSEIVDVDFEKTNNGHVEAYAVRHTEGNNTHWGHSLSLGYRRPLVTPQLADELRDPRSLDRANDVEFAAKWLKAGACLSGAVILAVSAASMREGGGPTDEGYHAPTELVMEVDAGIDLPELGDFSTVSVEDVLATS